MDVSDRAVSVNALSSARIGQRAQPWPWLCTRGEQNPGGPSNNTGVCSAFTIMANAVGRVCFASPPPRVLQVRGHTLSSPSPASLAPWGMPKMPRQALD